MSSKVISQARVRLVEATSAALKQCLSNRPQRWNSMECLLYAKSLSLHIFASMQSDGLPLPYLHPNVATVSDRNRLRRLSIWGTPPNWTPSTTNWTSPCLRVRVSRSASVSECESRSASLRVRSLSDWVRMGRGWASISFLSSVSFYLLFYVTDSHFDNVF